MGIPPILHSSPLLFVPFPSKPFYPFLPFSIRFVLPSEFIFIFLFSFNSFQSIYASLFTNEIILKELNEKRKMKINFKDGTNQIENGRKEWNGLEGKRTKRRGEE
jgi:hypothetical protein